METSTQTNNQLNCTEPDYEWIKNYKCEAIFNDDGSITFMNNNKNIMTVTKYVKDVYVHKINPYEYFRKLLAIFCELELDVKVDIVGNLLVEFKCDGFEICVDNFCLLYFRVNQPELKIKKNTIIQYIPIENKIYIKWNNIEKIKKLSHMNFESIIMMHKNQLFNIFLEYYLQEQFCQRNVISENGKYYLTVQYNPATTNLIKEKFGDDITPTKISSLIASLYSHIEKTSLLEQQIKQLELKAEKIKNSVEAQLYKEFQNKENEITSENANAILHHEYFYGKCIEELKTINQTKKSQRIKKKEQLQYDNLEFLETLHMIKKSDSLASIFGDIWELPTFDQFTARHDNLQSKYLGFAKILYGMDPKTRECIFFNNYF